MNINPSVLIVILNYGTFQLTLNLIKELKANLKYQNYTIMVVDNYSPNESARVLEERSVEMDFTFYANNKNAGYAAGNNIGIRYGIKNGFDYSWILNNDVELRDNNVLIHMVEIAEKDNKIGCIGPMIYSRDGQICAPYCRRPSFWSMTGGIGIEKRYRQQLINKSGEVYRVYGCCMLLKNKPMAEVDCMDERTFLYGEEDILAERMLAKGYISYYDAEVSVTHNESSSMKQMSRKRKILQIRETYKSMELYLKEYRNFSGIARWMCRGTRCLIIYFR
jgi:GT2 family glycosyltransferase